MALTEKIFDYKHWLHLEKPQKHIGCCLGIKYEPMKGKIFVELMKRPIKEHIRCGDMQKWVQQTAQSENYKTHPRSKPPHYDGVCEGYKRVTLSMKANYFWASTL